MLPPHIKHKDCPVVIFFIQGKDNSVRPGLYCSKHASWIKWLTHEEYKCAIELGVQEKGLLVNDGLIREKVINLLKLKNVTRTRSTKSDHKS